MGLRCLLSYIEKYHSDTLDNFNLQNCSIVIDGNNVLKRLYRSDLTLNSAYGGEYDKYAAIVATFFET